MPEHSNMSTLSHKIIPIALALMFITTSISLITPSSVQALTYYQINDTEQNGLLEVFNYTASNEVIDSMPTMAYLSQSWFTAKLNMTTEMVPDWIGGKTLKMRAWDVSTDTAPDIPVASMYIGHALNGLVQLSWDTKFNTNATTNIWKPFSEIGLGTAAKAPEYYINTQSYNATHVKSWLMMQNSTILERNVWHHMELIIDTGSGTLSWYVNGAFVGMRTGLATPDVKITHINVRSRGDTNKYMDTYMDNIAISVPRYVIQPVVSEDTRTCISITFDDGDYSVIENAVDAMYGAPGGLAIPPDAIGGVGKMSWGNVSDLVDAGWDVLSHSLSNDFMTSLSPSAAEYNFRFSKQWIEENITGYSVKGYVYPGHMRNESLDAIGKNYYEYLMTCGPDVGLFPRPSLAATTANMRDMFNLAVLVPSLLYGSYGYIASVAHGVKSTPAAYDTHTDAFKWFMDTLLENHTKIVSPNQALLAYNAVYATVSGNSTEFSIRYPSSLGNIKNSSVWVNIDGDYSNDVFVAVRDGEIIDTAEATDGDLIMLLEIGDYRIMTIADYRQMMFEDSISPIFAIIPLVIIFSVIPMVMGLGKKLK